MVPIKHNFEPLLKNVPYTTKGENTTVLRYRSSSLSYPIYVFDIVLRWPSGEPLKNEQTDTDSYITARHGRFFCVCKRQRYFISLSVLLNYMDQINTAAFAVTCQSLRKHEGNKQHWRIILMKIATAQHHVMQKRNRNVDALWLYVRIYVQSGNE